jgi:hypothetical protein
MSVMACVGPLLSAFSPGTYGEFVSGHNTRHLRQPWCPHVGFQAELLPSSIGVSLSRVAFIVLEAILT